MAATETAWKRRYRAARLSFPTWARDNPDRLVYTSNASGKFEVYAWDRAANEHRQVTDRPAGTGYMVPEDAEPKLVYQHPQSAAVVGISRDERLFAIAHSEHGDSRNRALRVLDLEGQKVADLWDGPGKGLEPSHWSPVAGDQRLIVLHERQGLKRPLIFDAAAGRDEEFAIDLPGEVSADWYPDARALLIAHDHRGRGELYRLDLATKQIERLS